MSCLVFTAGLPSAESLCSLAFVVQISTSFGPYGKGDNVMEIQLQCLILSHSFACYSARSESVQRYHVVGVAHAGGYKFGGKSIEAFPLPDPDVCV